MNPVRRGSAGSTRHAPGFFALASFAGLAAAVLFVGFPAIDFAVTDLFYIGERAFIFNYDGPGKDLRGVFNILFKGAVAVAVVGLIVAAFVRRNPLTLDFPRWLFLVLCFALAAGFTANVVLKDSWGRARPFHVKEYGGSQTFTPALVRSDQCRDNCSFVSGEAAAMFTLFFALALLAERRRRRLVLLGIGMGTAAGFVRIAQGGHFLSDVVFAGVFMALTVRLLHWFVFELADRTFADEGPVHARLLAAGRRWGAATAGWAGALDAYAWDIVTTALARVRNLRLPLSLHWLALRRKAPAATATGSGRHGREHAGPGS